MSQSSNVAYYPACSKAPPKAKKPKETKPKEAKTKQPKKEVPAAEKEEAPAENGEPKAEEVEKAWSFPGNILTETQFISYFFWPLCFWINLIYIYWIFPTLGGAC